MSHQGGGLPLHSSMNVIIALLWFRKKLCVWLLTKVSKTAHVVTCHSTAAAVYPHPPPLFFFFFFSTIAKSSAKGGGRRERERELLLSRGAAQRHGCCVHTGGGAACAAALRRCCCFSEYGWCYNARDSESNEYAVEASPCCRRPRGGLPLHRCHVHRRRLRRCRRPAPRHAPRAPAE